MLIDFSAAFDWVNHQGILYKLRSAVIGGPALSIVTVSIKPSTLWWMVVGVNMLTST